MTEGINYQVNTWLQTQGSFDRELMGAARASDMLGSSWSRMGSSMISAGERVRGSFGAMTGEFAKSAGMAIGGGMAAGIGFATAKGLEFNNYMEQGALGLATMYQTFGVNPAFDKNIELAQAMQQELVAIADASPGTTADIMMAYQSLAPGVTGVTQDLERQRALMEKIAVLGWTTGNDYKQLGNDVGRIVTGVAGADVSVFRTLAPTIKEAFEEVTGKAVVGDFAAEFNKVAKADGELALQIFEKAVSSIGAEANAAFGESFGGVLASVESRMLKLAGDFSKPLYDSMRESMVALSTKGAFGPETFEGLRGAAFYAGGLIADAFEKGAGFIDRTMTYVAQNWQQIADGLRTAGIAAGLAIKSAIVIGMTRHFVGSAMIVAGKMAEVFEAAKTGGGAAASWIGQQAKQTHMAMARGMKGGGSGMLGAAGRGLGSVFGKASGSKDPLNIFRGMDVGILKVASLGTTIGSLGVVATMVGTALGGVVVAIAGVGAYFVEHWDRISGSIVNGLQDGSITLVPLMVSLYTFYQRLVMVGEALLGGSSAVDTVNGGLSFLTTVIDMVSGALSWFVWGLSIMVGAWATLKLAMLGVMHVVLGIVEVANTLGAVSDSTLERARGNVAAFGDSVDATFHKADMLAAASEKIADAQLTPADYAKAEEKAKQLQQSLSDALAGTGTDAAGKKKGGRAAASKVKIDKVVVEVDMRDPDPDRLFSQFIPKLENMADRRVQPYEALEQGS